MAGAHDADAGDADGRQRIPVSPACHSAGRGCAGLPAPHDEAAVSRRGERFGTTACAVERAIRHAIEVCWQRGRIEDFNVTVGFRILSQQERPGNRELIALFAACVRSRRID